MKQKHAESSNFSTYGDYLKVAGGDFQITRTPVIRKHFSYNNDGVPIIIVDGGIMILETDYHMVKDLMEKAKRI